MINILTINGFTFKQKIRVKKYKLKVDGLVFFNMCKKYGYVHSGIWSTRLPKHDSPSNTKAIQMATKMLRLLKRIKRIK